MNDMKQKNQQEKQALTPMQKQAVLVCAVCAAAILLTAGITLVLLKRGKTPDKPVELPPVSDPASSEDTEDISDHYQISQTSSALLGVTEDAGATYQDQTLFLGDSNTVRLYANGLVSLQQFCAREGIGTISALNEQIVTFKRDDDRYTIPQAVAKMKPRRVVLTFGTNDTAMTVEEFIGHYKALVQAIQTAYPYTDIIVNTIPPVPEEHANYPQIEQTKIDDLNMALLAMCEELEIKFLNSAEALKDETGYGKAEYYQNDDIHLKSAGLKVILNYLRTHAYETEDRRPDTTNIPTRAEYTPDPSSAVEAPSSSAGSASQKVLYRASYRVDKTGGGTLSGGDQSEKALLNFDITDASEPIEVTAVPDEGYVFVKWSDGVTDKTRTDVDFKQNMDVTAVFAAASIKISSAGKAVLGDTYTFKATLNGKNLSSKSIRWYANGEEVTLAAGKTTVKVDIDESMLNATFRVYATATYNDCTVTSNTLEVTVSGITSASSSSGAESEAGSASSSSSSSSSASSSSSSTSSSSSASSNASSASSGSASSSASKAESTASSASSAASSSASSKADSASSGSASSKDPSSGKADASSASSKVESSASSTSGSKADSVTSSGSSSSASSTSNASSASGSASSSKAPVSSTSSGTSGSTSASSASSAESKPASSEKTEQPASRKEAEKDS